MLVAVTSDIHGNRHAFEAVLADVAATGARELWCLGDIVGYGADPDACSALVSEVVERCLAGNHDLVVRGDIDIGYFAMSAGAAARWTVKVINDQTREFLRPLVPLGEKEGVGLYHASPRDPVWEYVLSVRQAADCLQAQRQRVALIGHSHVACYFSRPNGDSQIEETIGEVAPAGKVIEIAEGRWLVNPGSVGQPRDGDPRAAWLMLDTSAWTARFHRVEYPVETAAKSIVDAGLPRQLADRLFSGQ
jgi:diadenosine tetraphosphatase ApaH/serine/threonine PP2A family protein phosphatase